MTDPAPEPPTPFERLGGIDGVRACRPLHLPFPIGTQVRDQWLACMGLAMAGIGEAGGFTADLQERLMISFANTADHMRNRPGR